MLACDPFFLQPHTIGALELPPNVLLAAVR